MALVFFSTLQQVDWGIHEVQERYFSTWIAWMPFPEVLGLQGLAIPILGGYALGLLFLINLCAGLPRVVSRHKIGLLAIHLGVLGLILSGFISAYYQEESQMWIPLNGKSFETESTYSNEWVLIDVTDSLHDTVYALDLDTLKSKVRFHDDQLPFDFEVKAFFPNAAIGPKDGLPLAGPQLATRGVGAKMDFRVQPLPLTFKENERNAATAYLALWDGDECLGVWLVSNILDDRFPQQRFTHRDRTYEVALRFKKNYLPFTFELEKFTHEVHPGTEIPKSFESVLWLNEKNGSRRRVEISMNEPLRYSGYTFYQASYAAGGEATMLQVVKNPGWLGPYVCVIVIAFGLIWHFLSMMWRRRN